MAYGTSKSIRVIGEHKNYTTKSLWVSYHSNATYHLTYPPLQKRCALPGPCKPTNAGVWFTCLRVTRGLAVEVQSSPCLQSSLYPKPAPPVPTLAAGDKPRIQETHPHLACFMAASWGKELRNLCLLVFALGSEVTAEPFPTSQPQTWHCFTRARVYKEGIC